jgi:hypothetical protein
MPVSKDIFLILRYGVHLLWIARLLLCASRVGAEDPVYIAADQRIETWKHGNMVGGDSCGQGVTPFLITDFALEHAWTVDTGIVGSTYIQECTGLPVSASKERAAQSL